jgi:CheY-like chemotaxis protein
MRAPDKLTILLVEDTHTIREILVHRLQQKGCRVTAVTNGADALAILRETRFSCVFCDMHMPPGQDGLATMAQLREYETKASRPTQPAYLLTADVCDPSLEQRAAGIVLGVVDKQLPVEHLVAMARAAQAGVLLSRAASRV